jgi:two-component system phosphate regulon sensor histidine kinase PhoR
MSSYDASNPVQRAVDLYAESSSAVQRQETSAASTEQLTRLLHVSSYLVSVLNPDELMESLVEQVVAALPAVQGGILWLYERRSASLRVVSTYGLPLAPVTLADLRRCQLIPGEGLPGQSQQSAEALLVETRNDYLDTAGRITPRNQAFFQRLAEELPPTLTDICIPLRVGNEISGVLELMNLGQAIGNAEWQPLRLDDIQMLQTFGNLAAAVIKNAQLYTQTQSHRRRLDAFDAVVTAISTATDLSDLIRSVLDVVLGLISVPAGALLLLDPSQARLTLGAQQGVPVGYVDALRSFTVTGAACEEAVRYGQPMLRPLIEERGETALLEAGLASCAYLPLLAGGTVVGVLGLYGESNLPDWVDMATLMPLGNQVGFAIANVRLYEDSQAERRKLNTVVNSIAEGVVLCDRQGRLVLANEAAMSLLSLDSVPFQQHLSEMTDFYGIRDTEGNPLPVERLPMARALSGELFHDYRVLLRGASGADTVMSFSGSPACSDNNDIEGAVVVFRDITASQKLERAKDEFLAIAAHELRSPLAAVRSYADLLLRREQQRSEADARDVRGLNILSQQVTHMLRMVDNLLDVSRLDAGQLGLQIQRVNLVPLANQVLDQQRPSAPDHELVLQTEEPELWVQCDSLRIRQVLTNLVGNALKYSPPETPVTIRLSMREVACDEPPSEEEQAIVVPQREALVAISDMGSGIAPEQQANLFQRYYRAGARRTEGLGLGLYLSRQFVLMHGGNIWVESSDGKGSTFYFTLPIEE